MELNEVIEQDDDGTVSPEEYIIFNLKKMGKVDDETIELLKDQFKALDADGSGELDADDITMLQKVGMSLLLAPAPSLAPTPSLVPSRTPKSSLAGDGSDDDALTRAAALALAQACDAMDAGTLAAAGSAVNTPRSANATPRGDAPADAAPPGELASPK